jgi:nitric oxide reductase subunit C
LLTAYIAYSAWVYTVGTESLVEMDLAAQNGKRIWQRSNCQNCHQLFGLGGYMGPDLTSVTTDESRGSTYARAIILSGGNNMPYYHFTESEADDIIAYLDHVNKAATANIR